jgi:hypothetical protein
MGRDGFGEGSQRNGVDGPRDNCRPRTDSSLCRRCYCLAVMMEIGTVVWLDV